MFQRENDTIDADRLPGFLAALRDAADRGEPIVLRELTFHERVDLSRLVARAGLVATGCVFLNGLDLSDARVTGTLDLSRSRLRNARVAEQLDQVGGVGGVGADSRREKILDQGGPSLHAPRLVVDGETMLCRVEATGRVDLRAADLRHTLDFRDAVCLGQWYLHSVQVGSQLRAGGARVFAGTSSQAVNLQAAGVAGSVVFDGGAEVIGRVDLQASTVGRLVFSSARIEADPSGVGVGMESACINGPLAFTSNTEVQGRVDIRARVAGSVAFSSATVRVAGRRSAVVLGGAAIGRLLMLSNATLIDGGVDASHATIATGLDASESRDRTRFEAPGCCSTPPATITGNLRLDYAEINGPARLHGLCVGGWVSVRHAKVRGDFDLCGGVAGRREADRHAHLLAAAPLFRGRWFSAVHETHQPLRRSPEERRGENRRPDVDLRLARVGGRLWVKGQRVLGDVDLEDARIEGEANFAGGTIHGDLRLRNATIIGRVFSDETDANGTPYPCVTGRLDARGATLSEVALRVDRDSRRPSPAAVRLDDATVRQLDLRWDFARHADANDPPRLFVHNLRFDDLTFGPTPGAVGGGDPVAPNGGAGRSARYEYSLRDLLRAGLWIGVWGAAMGAILTAGDAPWAGAAVFVGLAYLALTALSTERSWLPPSGDTRRRRRFLRHTQYSPAFYVTVEQWLRSRGDDLTADSVFLDHRRRELSEDRRQHAAAAAHRASRRRFGPAARVWRWCVMDFLLGYGVRPARMIHAFLLLLLLNWGVFLHRDSVQRPLTFPMAPDPAAKSDWAAYNHRDANAPNPFPIGKLGPGADEWDAQQAFFMALRVSVPVVDLFAESDWVPSSSWIRTPWGGRLLEYENYAAASQVANLIVIPLAIAGLTGFLKRRG